MATQAYKFAVQADALLQGQLALAQLNLPLWPDKIWADNIPVLAPLPPKRIYYPNIFKPGTPPYREALYQVQFGTDKKQTWLPFQVEADAEMWNRIGVTGWRETDHATINVDNPDYPVAVATRQRQKDDYLIALRAEYAGGHFVLMGYDGKVWTVMANQESPQWLGFIKKTILWDKRSAIKTMIKL